MMSGDLDKAMMHAEAMGAARGEVEAFLLRELRAALVIAGDAAKATVVGAMLEKTQ